MTAITDAQYKALYEILTSTETLQEFQNLKIPGRVSSSGPPFQPLPNVPRQTPSPILNQLFTILLKCPGFADGPIDQMCLDGSRLLESLAMNDLSDSYDKGSLSRRKILGVGVCVIAEKAFRGITSGVPRTKVVKKDQYDLKNADDVIDGWNAFIQELVYEGGSDKMVKLVSQTSDLKSIPPYLQAAHVYASTITASLLHYVLCVSAAGPTIVTLLDRVHAQLPYGSLRSALKYVNASTGASAVSKVLFSNSAFLGSSKRNLMLRIVSGVLLKDKEVLDAKIADLQKKAIAPEDESEAIRRYVYELNREQHVAIREKSLAENRSIVLIICEQANVSAPADEKVHQELLQLLTLLLGSRDRELMEQSVCSDPSDSLTSALSTLLDSFKDIIRSTHKASDLPEAVSALQSFMSEMLLTAKQNPTPQGFFDLCQKHQGDLHVFLHDICANSPKLVDAYAQWYADSLALYRRKDDAPLGSFTKVVDDLLSSLNEDDRQTVLKEADNYAAFSASSDALSRERFQAMLQGKPTDMGPGTAIMIWHDVVDKSAVRPSSLDGRCRFGGDASVQDASQQSEELADGANSGHKQKVDVLATPDGRPPVNGVKSLLEKFHKLLTQNRVISV